MPFSKFPEHFKRSNEAKVLHIMNKPLRDLQPKLFNALIKELKENKNLRELHIINCGLEFLDPNDFKKLLTGLNQLTTLNLDENGLSFNEKQLDVLSDILQNMPDLHTFTIHDNGGKKLAPNYFSVFVNFAGLRVSNYIDKYHFRNLSEVNTLLDFLKGWDDYKNSLNIPQFFDENIKEKSSYVKPKNKIPPLNAHLSEANNQRVTSSPQLGITIKFFDRLQGTGVDLSYNSTTDTYILDLTQITPASCEKVIDILPHKMPKELSWELILPTPLSHFAEEAINSFKKDNTINKLSIEEISGDKLSPLESLNRRDPDYQFLKALNQSFTVCNEEFYHLLTDKDVQFQFKLFNVFDRLKNILKCNDPNKKALKQLVYEFFVVHRLCCLPNEQKPFLEILKAIRDEKDKPSHELERFQQEVLELLNCNPKAISQQLEIIQKTPPLDRDEAALRTIMQAKAWWGKAAFFQNNKSAGQGIYFYGHFLREYYPQNDVSSQLLEHENLIPIVERRGLYWIRLAATHYKNFSAHTYLAKLVKNKVVLTPVDRYQLALACEELKIPCAGETFTNLDSFLILFPPRNFFTSLFKDCISHLMPNYLSFSSVALIPPIRSSRTMQSVNQQEQQQSIEERFYLYSLINDNLITDKGKVALLKELDNQRNGVIRSIELMSDISLYKQHEMLEKYHSAPLGMQLKLQIFPILETNIQNKHAKLDNEKPMEIQSIELRRSVFCQFFEKQLTLYLSECKLFGSKINPQENPSYVAVLIHKLLEQSLQYFKLENDPFAIEINQSMEKIKTDLQEFFFRQHLDTLDSFGFEQVMVKRFLSYATTAHVANSAQLTSLSKFGEQQQSEKEPPQESLLKKGLHLTAFGIQTFHVGLPLILTVTGVGIPAAIGTYAAFEGLISSLKMIHHYTKKVEYFVKENNEIPNLIMGLAHLHHDHHSKPLVQFDTIRHFTDLLTNAAVNDIDNILILSKHWAAVYKPFTEQLTETSNTLLGILLVELLMRGLTVRLTYEKKNIFGKQTKAIDNIPALLDYFNETIWHFSCPTASDDAQLMTKDMKHTFSALNIIFPKKMKSNLAGKLIDVTIKPNRLTQQITPFISEPPCSRFASSYEVNQMNLIRKIGNNSQIPFSLTEKENPSFHGWKDLNLMIAYQEKNTLAGDISFLSDRNELGELKGMVHDCLVYATDISARLREKPNERRKLELYSDHLRTLITILQNSIHKLNNPRIQVDNTLQDLPNLNLLNPDLSPRVAVRDFLEKLTAIFILIERDNTLNIDCIRRLHLAKMESVALQELAEPLLKRIQPQEAPQLEENPLPQEKPQPQESLQPQENLQVANSRSSFFANGESSRHSNQQAVHITKIVGYCILFLAIVLTLKSYLEEKNEGSLATNTMK